VSLELIFPVDKAYAALRDGAVEFVGGSAHSALSAFPEWRGCETALCAGARYVLVSSDACRLQGKARRLIHREGQEHWCGALGRDGIASLLTAAGFDLARDGMKIAPVPGALGPGVNFGVTAAKALEERKIDGFWANGMGAEVAVKRGIGTVVLDIRRGDGPAGCFNYTMASIAATDALIARSPDIAAAAIRAIVKTQAALRANPERASEVGKTLFPVSEATLIAELIRRDLPYYDASISQDFVAG